MDDFGRPRLRRSLAFWLLLVVPGLAIWWLASKEVAAQERPLPSVPLHYGFFKIQFATDGTFSFDGEGIRITGTWKRIGTTVEISTAGARDGCDKSARYTFVVAGSRVSLVLAGDDACVMRRMVLDSSSWLPVGEEESIPERRIVRTAAPSLLEWPKAPSE